MVVGEAPGQQEYLQGQPFVGPVGQFLRSKLKNPSEIFFTNAFQTYPGLYGLEHPSYKMVDSHNYLLCGNTRDCEPATIFALGEFAYYAVTGQAPGLMRNIVGTCIPDGEKRERFKGIPVMVAYHPGFVQWHRNTSLCRKWQSHLTKWQAKCP